MKADDSDSDAPSPEAVDDALRAFWRGSSQAVDALAAEEGGSIPERLESGKAAEGGCSTSSDDAPSLGAAFAHLYEQQPADPPIEMVTGDYVVIREIGRGGMGVVYEARQELTGRPVALKVMQHRSASEPTHVRLFRREVKTLAHLKHPCIATLYDAGQTDSGQDYFAMELVRGRPLRDYWREHSTTEPNPELLRLFQRICDGMNYAHQRGVIHRDLKPSNILVDDDGQPKILDFGLARLHDPDGELMSNVTESGRILGTLAYMSPEQARGEAEAVDIRSDVYTLGIVLYELLTGARPYEVKTSAWAEAVRKINEAPVVKPSEANPALRGDLETIVLKAIAKEPVERYASAAALGEDIDRYLTNLPILARTPSGLYQLRKLILRHKAPAALAAALFIVVATSAVLFGIQKSQVSRERDEAKAQALRAERISAYITGMLQSMDPKIVGANVSVKDLLDQAAARLEKELAHDAETRASMHETLAKSYIAMENYERGEHHAQEALALRRELTGEHDLAYAATLNLMGVADRRRNGTITAEEMLKKAYDLRVELLGTQNPAVAESLKSLADNEFGMSRFIPAEKLYRESIKLWQSLGGHEQELAATLDNYAEMLTAAGRYEEAEPQLIQALGIRRKIYGDDQVDVARTLTDLGEIYTRWGQFENAEKTYREQVRILRKLFPDGHRILSHALSDLAWSLGDKGAFSQAEAMHKEAMAMEERCSGPHDNQLTKNNFAKFLTYQGRYKEAEPLGRIVYQEWEGWSPIHHRAKGYACQNLAAVLFELRKLDEAKKLYEDAETCWRELFGIQNPMMVHTLIGLGQLAELRGDQTSAERLYREAFDIRHDRLGPTHPETAIVQVYLAGILPVNSSEATPLCDAALGSLRKRWGDVHADVAWALGRYAVIERARGDIETAEKQLREAIEIERKLERKQHPNLAACLVELGEILLDRGDAKDARPMFEEALAIEKVRFSDGDERIARTQRDLERCGVPPKS